MENRDPKSEEPRQREQLDRGTDNGRNDSNPGNPIMSPRELQALMERSNPFRPDPRLTEITLKALQTGKIPEENASELVDNGYAQKRGDQYVMTKEAHYQLTTLYPKEMEEIGSRELEEEERQILEKQAEEKRSLAAEMVGAGSLTIDSTGAYRITDRGMRFTGQWIRRCLTAKKTHQGYSLNYYDPVSFDGLKVGEEWKSDRILLSNLPVMLGKIRRSLTQDELQKLGMFKPAKLTELEQRLKECALRSKGQ